MDSSSFSSITNQYQGRFIELMEGGKLKIHDEKKRFPIFEPAISDDDDEEEEDQQHRFDVSTIDVEEEEEEEEKEEEAVPYVIVVQGPPNVGKSLLIKSLVKVFTGQKLDNIRGPITVVAGEHRRLQFVECPNDINGMIDAAKYADLVLLCIDASYGFEMETFEFFNLLQVHGSPNVHGIPNVIGVFSHVDKIEGNLTKTKERLGRQFWNEIYFRAGLFYLSCPDNGMYKANQILKLANLIAVEQFNPLSWQTAHPYVLVDHFKDVTSEERLHADNTCDRNIVMYGYLRGSNLKEGAKVHIAGVGDFSLHAITNLADPCSLPSAAKMKGVSDKERLFYAPMSVSGDLPYDKDAEYIDELTDHDEGNQLEIEGFRAGTYLKLEVHNVPFEMTKNVDPYCPILVGGISHEEENVGIMQVRFKQHRWHKELLKTGNPFIVSVGWRRYQTRPIYAQEHDGNCLHQIHHIPKHTDCLAMFRGPLAPQDTGVVAVRNLAGNKAAFRISAMGVILDFTQAAAEIVAEIVKSIGLKRKRVGTPLKIIKKTALTEDMFISDHEIDWFEVAAIQTARGVRGNAKKTAKKKLVRKLIRKGDQPREGAASCSFQHENSQSDKGFMHGWKRRRAVVFTETVGRSGRLCRMKCKEYYQPIRRPKKCEEPVREKLSKKEKKLKLEFIKVSNEIVEGWRSNH